MGLKPLVNAPFVLLVDGSSPKGPDLLDYRSRRLRL